MTEIRIVTFNAGAGSPTVTTPEAALLELPFYREALTDAPGAPILALQEVGPAQARALRHADGDGRCRVLQARRPGQGNALVVPARYELLARRRRPFVAGHVRGARATLGAWAWRGHRPDWRQLGEARLWIEAWVRDRAGGAAFTVLTTHLSVEPYLRLAQAQAIVARALAAPRPVLLAGDLNVPRRAPGALDVRARAVLAALTDVGPASPPGRHPDVDHVLGLGVVPVRARVWTGASLSLPGHPTAESISDHDALDVTVRLAELG
ncbi:MAG: endonuclease/exonuclease/phosphatase family protein [Actinomycetota bacterium]|nr:endonuclease/exonuclease/phosphatase family protein [Actinomycetota bacterium]